MKILLTIHQFFPQYSAGTEVLTYGVARELIARGHKVRIFTGYPASASLSDEERFDEYEYEGIHVYRFHHAYVSMGGQISMVEVGSDNHLAANHFEYILKSFKPDLVHFFHLNRLGTGLIDRGARLGIPLFMTSVDFWIICPTGQLVLNNGKLCSGPDLHAGNCVKHYAQNTQKGLIAKAVQLIPNAVADFSVKITKIKGLPKYPYKVEVAALGSRLEKNIMRLNQLKKIVSPNSFMTETLIRHGVLPESIAQLAFGIDLSGEKTKKERQLPHKPFQIGYIGTLAPHKGCHVLIEAFNSLPKGRAVLNVYGNTKDFPEYANTLMRMAKNNSSINFCGTFPNGEINEIFANLDVLVVPSMWYENTPLVIYSAQAAGCPVVASDFPGISEVIQHELNGLLFKAGNSTALAAQLSRFIGGESDLLNRLSMNSIGPKSINTYVDELLNIWEKI